MAIGDLNGDRKPCLVTPTCWSNTVAALADGLREAGHFTAALDASDLHAGMYFVRMQAKGMNLTRRLVVVK